MSIQPVAGIHRNQVWRVRTADGATALMLKLQTTREGFPTVEHEADVLRHLRWLAGVPRLVAAGTVGRPKRPFLLTQAISGVPLAHWLRLDRPAAASQLANYAHWLRSFSLVDAPRAILREKACRFEGPWAMNYSPDVAPPVIINDASAGDRLAANHNHVAVVHGSFDPRNVLVADDATAQLTGVVDFEATRLGSPLIDIAGLALHFLMWRRADLASAWLTAASEAWQWPSLAIDAMPYLVAQHERRRAAAMVNTDVPIAPRRLISNLLATIKTLQPRSNRSTSHGS